MIHMLQTLVNGNFRSWGPVQYRQYKDLFHGKYVGIELETLQQSFQQNTIRALREDPFRWSYYNERRGSEIQVLLPISNPIVFRKTITESWRTLILNDFDLTGSMHVNVDYAETSSKIAYWWFLKAGTHSIIWENKYCIASTNVKTVVAQIALSYLWFHDKFREELIPALQEATNKDEIMRFPLENVIDRWKRRQHGL